MKPHILTVGGSGIGGMVRGAVELVHAASEKLMNVVVGGSTGNAAVERLCYQFSELHQDLATTSSYRELMGRYLRAVDDAGTPPNYLLTWKRLDRAVTASRCRDFYAAELLKQRGRGAQVQAPGFSYRFKIFFLAEHFDRFDSPKDELLEMVPDPARHAFYLVDDYLTWHTSSLLQECLAEVRDEAPVRERIARWKSDLARLLVAESRLSSTPLRSFFSRAFGYAKMKLTPKSFMRGSDILGYCTDRLFVDRAISLPDDQRAAAQRELGRVGGFLGAQFKAAEATVRAYRHLKSFDLPESPGEVLGGGAGAWAEWLASGLDVGIRVHHAPRLDACMVQTRRKIIWLGDHLTPERRAFATFHELAHLILEHRGNSEYGLNPLRLGEFEARHFDWQEREANAFAMLLTHTLSGVAGDSAPSWWELGNPRAAPVVVLYARHKARANRGGSAGGAAPGEGGGAAGRGGEGTASAREDAPDAGPRVFAAGGEATGDGEGTPRASVPAATAESRSANEESGSAHHRSRTAA